MTNRPVWMHIENLQAAMRATKDVRATAIAMELLARHAPEGVGAFDFDSAAIAAMCSRDREKLNAADIAGMREDLLQFFTVLPDGRWAPSPAIFVANDPYGEAPD
jgi:hypothetical protein